MFFILHTFEHPHIHIIHNLPLSILYTLTAPLKCLLAFFSMITAFSCCGTEITTPRISYYELRSTIRSSGITRIEQHAVRHACSQNQGVQLQAVQ